MISKMLNNQQTSLKTLEISFPRTLIRLCGEGGKVKHATNPKKVNRNIPTPLRIESQQGQRIFFPSHGPRILSRANAQKENFLASNTNAVWHNIALAILSPLTKRRDSEQTPLKADITPKQN